MFLSVLPLLCVRARTCIYVCACFFASFFQFFGVWELWKASSQLLKVTLGADLLDAGDLDPAPENAMVSFTAAVP